MLKIPQIFKLIDLFYHHAKSAFETIKQGQNAGYYMPDEPEKDLGKYPELTNIIQQINDPNLASELLLIAEMYKEAIKMGSGYNSINKAISNFMNMYLEDEDDEQQQAIEDVLNDVVKDLRARAGGGAALSRPDNPEVIAKLKAFKDQYNAQTLQEEVDDLSKYEESAAPVFDPTGGMSFEEARKGPGRGYSVRSNRSPKDWAESYENEKMRYTDTMLSATGQIKDKIKKLVEVLDKLKKNALEEAALDPEQTDKIEHLKTINQSLRKERAKLKSSIRNYELSHMTDKLESKITETNDPIEKLKLQQEIELNKLLASRDLNKKEEINWRRLLIKSISGGNVPSQETIKNMLERINAASQKKVSAEEWRKRVSLQRREKINKGVLEGLLIELSDKLATRKSSIKQTIVDELNAAEHTIFQPYLDKLVAAKLAGDEKNIKLIAKELKKAISDFAEVHPSVRDAMEISKEFYRFRDQAKTIEKTKLLESDIVLPDEVKNVLSSMIDEGKELIGRFKGVERFGPIIKSMETIIKLIEGKLT